MTNRWGIYDQGSIHDPVPMEAAYNRSFDIFTHESQIDKASQWRGTGVAKPPGMALARNAICSIGINAYTTPGGGAKIPCPAKFPGANDGFDCVSRGDYDTELNAWITALVSYKAEGGQVHALFHLEPALDNAGQPTAGTSTEYKNAFNHVYPMFHAAGLLLGWDMTSAEWRGGTAHDWEPTNYDILSSDFYPEWKNPGDDTLKTMQWGLGDMFAYGAASKPTLPIMVRSTTCKSFTDAQAAVWFAESSDTLLALPETDIWVGWDTDNAGLYVLDSGETHPFPAGPYQLVKEAFFSAAADWTAGDNVHTITGTANTDATLITAGFVDTVMDPRALCVCEDNVLRFDPTVSTTLTIDAQNLMFMDTARLEMNPSDNSVVHTLRFTNVDENGYTGGALYPVNSVGPWVPATSSRALTLQLRSVQPDCNLVGNASALQPRDKVVLSQFYAGSAANYNNNTPVASYTGTFPVLSVSAPAGTVPNLTQNIVVQFPSDPGSPGALSMPVPGNANVTIYASVVAESPAVNDHGLWFMGSAVADLVGTTKLGWGRANGTLNAGATSATVVDSVTGAAPNPLTFGWAVGDEVVISPTDLSYNHDEVRTITSVAGHTIGFTALSYSHPLVVPKTGLSFGAEIANLTRNVRIEGQDATHRTHMMFHNTVTTPQTVKYTQLRYLGPREIAPSGQGNSRKIIGRWPFHFHKEGVHSVGSLLLGSVTRDCGSHSYVQHASNGVTIRDCVSYHNLEISFWWDQDADSDRPSAVVWDHNMVGWQFATDTAQRMAGFLMAQTALPEGDATMKDCCAWGVRGGDDGGGGGWNTEGATSPQATQWITQGVTVFHNNQSNGFGSWINAPLFRSDHSDFVLYRNGRGGLSPEGAYSTNLSYTRVTMFENGWGSGSDRYQWRSLANAKVDPDNQWSIRKDCYADSNGLVGVLLIGETNSNGDAPLQILDCQLRNSLGPAITLDMVKVGVQLTHQVRDFVRCSVRDIGASTDHDVTLADINNVFLVGGSRLRFQDRDDTHAWEMVWTLTPIKNDTTNTFVVHDPIAPFALRVTTQSLPNATQNVAYGPGGAGKALTADLNQGAMTWALKYGSAGLPTGLALSSAGVLSGTPTVPGSYPFTVEVTDARGVTAPKDLTLIVASTASLQITTTSLPGGFVGVSYSQTLASTGGTGTKTWTLASGTLPAGLGLSTAGVISGTPTTIGSSSFTVRVTDTASATDTRALVIAVTSPTPIIGNTSPLPTGSLTVAYAVTLTATGGTLPYTWSLVSGTLQTGLSLNASTGAITGTPTVAAVRSLTFRCTDVNLVTADKVFSLTTVNAVTFGASTPPPGVLSKAYSYTFVALNGVPPYNFVLDSDPSTLAPGLSISIDGVLSGTPTEAGTWNFSVQVGDSAAVNISTQVSLLIRKHIPHPKRGLSVRSPSRFPSGN